MMAIVCAGRKWEQPKWMVQLSRQDEEQHVDRLYKDALRRGEKERMRKQFFKIPDAIAPPKEVRGREVTDHGKFSFKNMIDRAENVKHTGRRSKFHL